MRKAIFILLAAVFFLYAAAGSGSAEEAAPAGGDEGQTIGRELIATQDRIWQITEGTLICRDLTTGEILDRMPMSSGGKTGGRELYRIHLLAGGEESIRILGAWRTEEGKTEVRMIECGTDGENRIRIRGTEDATAALGAFFEEENGWLQTEMTAWGDGILMTAMDGDFRCHFYRIRPGKGSRPEEIGQRPYATTTAAIPYGEGILLAGDSLRKEGDICLATMNPENGETTEMADIPAGASAPGQNYAWDPEREELFFTIRNTAYRAEIRGGAKPEPIAVFPEEPAAFGKGTIAGGQYILQTEEGELLRCETGAEIRAARIRIANRTENTDIEDITARFNAAQGEWFLSTERGEGPVSEYDAVILNISGGEYRELIREGRWADLSESEGLREAGEEMQEGIREATWAEGRMAALAIGIETPSLTIHRGAYEALTGRKGEEIPKDWEGFLGLIKEMGENGGFEEHPEYAIATTELSAEEFREILLIYVIRSAMLDAAARKDGEAVKETLPGMLKAFREIDWTRMGLRTEGEEWNEEGEEKIPMISEEAVEITTGMKEEGIEIHPMAARAGGEEIIPQQITALMINGESGEQECMRQWAEFAWAETDIATKMSLCPGMKEPVTDPDFEMMMGYLEEILAEYGEILEEMEEMQRAYDEMGMEPEGREEAEALREKYEEIKAFAEEYREEGIWLISEESMEAYRGRRYAPDPCAFWETEEGIEKTERYLEGEMTEEELIRWVREMMR